MLEGVFYMQRGMEYIGRENYTYLCECSATYHCCTSETVTMCPTNSTNKYSTQHRNSKVTVEYVLHKIISVFRHFFQIPHGKGHFGDICQPFPIEKCREVRGAVCNEDDDVIDYKGLCDVGYAVCRYHYRGNSLSCTTFLCVLLSGLRASTPACSVLLVFIVICRSVVFRSCVFIRPSATSILDKTPATTDREYYITHGRRS